MLTFQDCLGLVDLSEEEILAIAEHEHVPEIIALELGEYLLHRPDGSLAIKKMILDDIQEAVQHNDRARELRLKATLKHFVDTHPENPARVTTA